MLAEQDLLLAGQMLRIRIDRDVIVPGRIGQSSSLCVDAVQQPLQEIDLSLPIHDGISLLLAPTRDKRTKTKSSVPIRYRITCERPVNTFPYQDLSRWPMTDVSGRDTLIVASLKEIG